MKNMKNIEKELNTITALVRMKLIDIDKLESILKDLSKKYDMPIIWRDRNRTTNERTIKVIA